MVYMRYIHISSTCKRTERNKHHTELRYAALYLVQKLQLQNFDNKTRRLEFCLKTSAFSFYRSLSSLKDKKDLNIRLINYLL